MSPFPTPRAGPTRFPRLMSAAVALGGMACVVACATSGEKGGLVPLSISRAALDQAHRGHRYALVVGIDRFDDPGWRELHYAAKDASDLAGVLADPHEGDYEVVERNEGAGTDRASILASLEKLRALDTAPDDVVLIYFSTHGTLARDATGELRRYLVARDTRMDEVGRTGIALDELEKSLDAFPSRRKVLVLATCHSGSGKSLLPPDVLRELQGTKAEFFAHPLEDVSRASIVLAACDWGETAREDAGLQNDIYTHFLVEALRRPADRNGDGAVSATEAHDYARRKTFEFTRGQQRPSAQITEVGADPVILSGQIVRAGRPEVFGYEAALDGAELRIDGDLPLALPGGRAIAAGTHHLQVTKGGGITLYDGEVSLGLGERLDVEDLLTRQEPRVLVGLAGGYQGFLDRDAAQTIAGPTAAAQLSVDLADAVARHLGARADFSYAGGERSLRPVASEAPVAFRFTGIQLGLALPYQRRFGPMEIELGPRLSALYLGRDFRLDTYRASQSYFTFTPGLTGGLAYRVTPRWAVFARGDVSYEYVRVDDQGRSLGFAGAWAGLGYRL